MKVVPYPPPSYTYINTYTYTHARIYICIYIHICIYSVSPHRVNICFTTQMSQFYHTGEDQQRRWCLIHHHHIHIYTYTYVHTCTHIYICIYTYIYIYIYSVSPHRCLSFTTLGKIYTPTLFRHTELISALPHRWLSFITLWKTNNEGGALSITIIYIYTHTHTHMYTQLNSTGCCKLPR